VYRRSNRRSTCIAAGRSPPNAHFVHLILMSISRGQGWERLCGFDVAILRSVVSITGDVTISSEHKRMRRMYNEHKIHTTAKQPLFVSANSI